LSIFLVSGQYIKINRKHRKFMPAKTQNVPYMLIPLGDTEYGNSVPRAASARKFQTLAITIPFKFRISDV
jgi:hypothetical protein